MIAAMTSQNLTCQELVELVTSYLEGSLPPEERLRFERHLAICDGCATYVEQMRITIQAVGRLTESAIEPETKDELLRIFRDWKRDA